LERFQLKAEKLTLGPGLDDYNLGPLVSQEQYDRVTAYLNDGRKGAGKLRFGGGRPPHLETGYFVEPTLFECADMTHAICREEIFGPVAVAIPFQGEEQAVEMANSLEYGLVAGVYCRDISRALSLASRIDAGSIWINGWFVGGVQAPTGGNKDSGIGRERGLPGVRNYLSIKNIGIRL
jgi:aldehyde dehydrogenase (NAD+)